MRAIAYRLDVERTNDQVKGSLHGVPNLVKDSKWVRRQDRVRDSNCLDFDTATELGMNTTAGSFVLLKDGGELVGDTFVIKQLRNAGTIILAKANLMEVGSYVSTPQPTNIDCFGYFENVLARKSIGR